MTIKEEWRDISDYEGLYQVSNLGRVKSFTRNTITEHIMKTDGKQRYKAVELFKNGISKRMLVHRLVATAFVDNTHNYEVINHIDGNRKNNTAENLEWCTQSHNVRHSYAKGLQQPTNTVMVLRDDGKVYNSLAEAGRELGTTNKKIWKICNGFQRRYNGHSFKYLEV